MLAAVQVGYGDLEQSIRLNEVPRPAPARGEVLLRVMGCRLNRKELFALANLTGPGIRPRPALPQLHGADAWGTVAPCRSNVFMRPADAHRREAFGKIAIAVSHGTKSAAAEA